MINIVKPWLKNLSIDYRESNIAILGLAFKGRPETSDVRGSLSIDLAKLLKKLNFKKIFLFDPLDETYESPEVQKYFSGCRIINNFKEIIAKTDLAIITNNHQYFQNQNRIKNLWKTNPKLKVFDFWNNLNNPGLKIDKDKYKAFGVNID